MLDNDLGNVPAPQPKKFIPYVTYSLIGFTVLVYLAGLASESYFGINLAVAFGIKHNPSIQQGQWWRLFTSIFLHGQIWHIGLQMLWLYWMGRNLESLFGRLSFLILYLLSGFAGSALSVWVSPETNSYGSGSGLFGLIAAQVAYLYLNRNIFGNRAWDNLRSIGIIIGINILFSLIPGFDQIGLIGGLLGGLLYSWFAAPKLLLIPTSVENQSVLLLKNTRSIKDTLLAALIVLAVFGAIVLAKVSGLLP